MNQIPATVGRVAATSEAFCFVLAVGLWQPRRCLPLPPDGLVRKKAHRKALNFNLFAEREAPEPTLSENIIKLQITDNHILSTMQSKSKSF